MKCINELFEEQAERAPDSIAVVFEGRKLTYRELNRRTDELAGQLRVLGVGPDGLVALFLERSPEMVVGLLGVLKAGGAYLPLDPVLPRKRLAYMVADAQPVVVITQPRLQSELPPNNAHNVVIDAEAPPVARPEQRSAGGRARDLHDLAYVIYTSGSTGEPKDVEIEDRALGNMLASMQRRPGFSAEDTILAITTIAFDIAAMEIFLPLVSGGCVVIAPSQTAMDAGALIDLIARSDATVLQATPATLRMLLDAGWAGDGRLKVFCGGEAWMADLASELLPRCGSLWNMYGPTETTVWSAVAKVEAGRPIAIGPPIAKTRLYVLDGSRQLVPAGVVGELYIGGAGLARGYLRRPQLTHESFVADPFSEQPGARMYRTGDLVRRQTDGSIEFLGRIDHQVKIRAHRIELGEIEVALARHPTVEQAVVMAREDSPGDIRLVAYIIPSAGSSISAGELRLLLGETLPAYLIPATFVSLVSFPLTPNGKLDREALPAPDASARETDVAPVEPRSETERVLERIWCEALGLERIDVRANFFDVGGHSILAASVIRNINKTLNARAGIIDLFGSPTIEMLAATIERNRQNGKRPSPDNGGRVVRLKDGPVGLPIYFIGAGPVEHHIGQMIGGDRALFATDVPLPLEWRRAIAGEDRSALPNIAQLRALHGDLLHAHARSSPCVVAGYSFGGKLAFETARALQLASGGNVAFVLLVDAFTWSGYIGGTAQRSLQSIWRGGVTGSADDPPNLNKISASLANSWRLLMWLLARLPLRVKSRAEAPGIPHSMFDQEGRRIDQAVINRLARIAGKSFHPHPLDAAGVLIRARLPGEGKLPG
jgi:amino acid adenylation domain-containing protein